MSLIIEEKEATDEQKKIGFGNGGLMALRRGLQHALAHPLDAVGNDKCEEGEYHLTDIVAIAHGRAGTSRPSEVPVDNVIGINNRAELAEAETIWQNRKRRELMLSGVTLIAPETVFFSYDTVIEPDVVIEPNVFFGPSVHVASGALIHSFSHLEGAQVGERPRSGHLPGFSPGADLAENPRSAISAK